MLCYICDDDVNSLRAMESLFLENTKDQDWQVKTFSNADSLKGYLYKHKPELLIMDIDLNGVNGIELVCEVHDKYPGLAVIFVSGYISFCSAVYEAEHIYFLPKPINKQDFTKAMAKVRQKIDKSREQQLLIKSRNNIAYINYEDIIYIENSGRKVRIQTNDSLLEAYMSIETLSETLDSRFVHCHKSYILNMNYIKTKNKNIFILKNGLRIPISQSRLAQTKSAYLTYLGETL